MLKSRYIADVFLAASCFSIGVVLRAWMEPRDIISFIGDRQVRYMLLYGGEWKGLIPPRCRNVAEGTGCWDWLEPGEKEFPKQRAK